MTGNVVNHRHRAMKEVYQEHEAMLRELDEAFSARLKEAEERFLATLSALDESMSKDDEESSAKEEVSPVTNVPAAVWMEMNGEYMLVLNQAAAVQQLALLEKLQEVLGELAKLAPKKAARVA